MSEPDTAGLNCSETLVIQSLSKHMDNGADLMDRGSADLPVPTVTVVRGSMKDTCLFWVWADGPGQSLVGLMSPDLLLDRSPLNNTSYLIDSLLHNSPSISGRASAPHSVHGNCSSCCSSYRVLYLQILQQLLTHDVQGTEAAPRNIWQSSELWRCLLKRGYHHHSTMILRLSSPKDVLCGPELRLATPTAPATTAWRAKFNPEIFQRSR